MVVKNIFSAIAILFTIFVKCQLSLEVKEINYENFLNNVPKNKFSVDIEKKYEGHILEISIINHSTHSISFPLDTLSYALPYTEKTEQYYSGKDNIPSEPDLLNILGIYPFVYQNGKFISREFDMTPDPFYIVAEPKEKTEIKAQRLNKIKEWKQKNNIKSDLTACYNSYIVNHMITIAPNKEVKYKIHFNPYLKRLDSFGYQEFYWPLNSKSTYEVTFKLILTKGLYKFLTTEDKLKYPNLFMGVISSKKLIMSTKENVYD